MLVIQLSSMEWTVIGSVLLFLIAKWPKKHYIMTKYWKLLFNPFMINMQILLNSDTKIKFGKSLKPKPFRTDFNLIYVQLL